MSEPRLHRSSTDSTSYREIHLAWLALLIPIIVCGAFIAYLPALSAAFVWDDDDYIWKNPLVVQGAGSQSDGESSASDDLRALADIWAPRFEPWYHVATPQYYPVVFTTFWIEYRLYPGHERYGTHPLGYHLVNLLLHIGNALLIMALARRIGIPLLPAWAIALLFALHPVQVESVAWVTERKNALSTCFYLLAGHAYLAFDVRRSGSREKGASEGIDQIQQGSPRSPWGWYAIALLLFGLALLSKSVAASLPVAIVLMLLFMRQRLTVKRLWPLAPMLLLGAAAGLHTGYLERSHVGAIGPDWEFSFLERILIASRALLFYPWKIIWPAELTFIYPRWEIDARDIFQWLPLVIETIAAAALVYLWWKRGVRWPLLACAFYAVTIFPALGFANIYPMRFSFVADHFQYLASAGIIALLVAAMWLLAQRRPQVMVIAAILLGTVLGVLTWRQAREYRSEEALYRAIIERNPDAWMAHSNLARFYLEEAERARLAEDAERMHALAERAEHHARTATGIKPENERPWTNLAEALRAQDELEEAIAAMNRAIEALSGERAWLVERGVTEKLPWADYHLAIDYGSLARLHEAQQEEALAVESYEMALEHAPLDAASARLRINLHARLADLLAQRDRLEEAAPHYAAVLREQPRDLPALVFQCHLALGEFHRRQGRFSEAEAHLTNALDGATSPEEEMQAAYRLGWLKATARDARVRDGAYAARVGEMMLRVTGSSSADAFDLYAAALADLGRYDEAAQMAGEALKLAEAYELDALADAVRTRIELYREGRPYRE